MKKWLMSALLGLFALSSSAFAEITIKEPDMTDFYSGVGTALGIAAIVMVAKRLKGFFR